MHPAWSVLLLFLCADVAVNSATPLDAAAVPSTTTLTADNATSYTADPLSSVTLTATVTAGATGKITFQEGDAPLRCAGGNPTVISNGSATCVTRFSAEGVHDLRAIYAGDGSYLASSGDASVFVQNHAASVGSTYCNPGPITATGRSGRELTRTTPYPSTIFVGDGVNFDPADAVSTVSLQLKAFSTRAMADLHMLLVAPDGTHAYAFLSGTGTQAAAGTYTIIDGANPFPLEAAVSPGVYSPTVAAPPPDFGAPGRPVPVPQIPERFAYAAPAVANSQTLQSSFQGAPAHGAWSLFVSEANGTASIAGGWCLTITPALGHPTTTALTSNRNLRTGETRPATLTATVTADRAVSVGSVSFTADGVALPGTSAVAVLDGVATMPASALAEGDHTIGASYHDDTGTFSDSTATSRLRVDRGTAQPKTSAPSTMTANPGTTPQSATVNTAFANAVAVTVKNATSNPVAGVNVTFTAPGSGASGVFSNGTATITVASNASGIAAAPITANATAGGPYTVTAAASGLTSVNFSLTNSAGAPASLVANSNTTPQSAAINTAFTAALAVAVKDSSNNPVPSVNVSFAAPGSGASGHFTNATANITVATNASGFAFAPFTANGTAGGPYTVTAAVAGLTTANFSLTNLASAPSSMTANPGTTPQSATVGTAFANAIAVTVKNASSNPIAGVDVTFTAPGSGASGVFSNSTTTIVVVTNASGIASAPITANVTPGGPYTVTASAAGATTVNFSLTNSPVATSMTANPGTTPQSATVGTAFTNALAVTLKNGSTPVSGLNVTFTAPGSGASGGFGNGTATITVATNASGIAAAPITANSTAGGPYTVTAAFPGLTSVNFSLTNSAGAATSMTANANTTPQSAAINTAFTTAPAVAVKDSSGNPVSGVSISFVAPGSGASGHFSNATANITVISNASGLAFAPFTANSTAGGPYTVTASATGLPTVNFSLTNLTSAPSSMVANPGTTPQSATINTTFTNALGVTVKDAGSNPISGVNVTFTAPSSGASGVFSNNTSTIVVVTNASGVAAAPFTANATAGGPYTVTATVAGLTAVNFSMTNQANKCDTTLDGHLTAADVQSSIAEALGTMSPAHNANADSVVNVVDVQIVLNAVAGLGCSAI